MRGMTDEALLQLIAYLEKTFGRDAVADVHPEHIDAKNEILRRNCERRRAAKATGTMSTRANGGDASARGTHAAGVRWGTR